MNAFFKKEIRLLLPNFLIGCVLTFSLWLLRFNDHRDFANFMNWLILFIVSPALAVMVSLDSFGIEVSSGTFAGLLAQPISRLKIWQTKIGLLAVAILVLTFLWSFNFVLLSFFGNNQSEFSDPIKALTVAFMFSIVVFTGGLWTVLLLRQVAVAFWFTLLIPGVLMIITVGLCGGESEEFITGMVVSVLGIYSLAGFFLARWLFFRAQDLQWSGGTIAMPEINWLKRRSTHAPQITSGSTIATQKARPRAVLWRKEFSLHQSQFVMAFVLLLLHLGVLAARQLNLVRSPDAKFCLEIFWGLWLVMPVLLGCAAIAEERKIGTLENQLCLPVKRRTQFAIKLSVVLILSVLLGAIMPLLLEGFRILPDLHFGFGELRADWQNHLSATEWFFYQLFFYIAAALPLIIFVGGVMLAGSLAFYASSLARNTLQSLAPALLGILLLAFLLIGSAQPLGAFYPFLWSGPLACFIALPVLILTLLSLAFFNFQHVRTSVRLGARNCGVILAALLVGVLLTSAIYHRGWEKITAIEPSHGAAKLAFNEPPKISFGFGVNVRLADGRIWRSQFQKYDQDQNLISQLLGNHSYTFGKGGFFKGSNWLSVQFIRGEFAGLKTDGTLWLSETRAKLKDENAGWKMDENIFQNLVPFGTETNWSSFRIMGDWLLLVKMDGTLWRWGAKNFDWKHNEWPGLRHLTPERIGTESNWEEVYHRDREDLLRQTDGSMWTFNLSQHTNGHTLSEIEPGLLIQSVKEFGYKKYRSTTGGWDLGGVKIGVDKDGSLRIFAEERVVMRADSRYGDYDWFPQKLQIGHETNWLEVSSVDSRLIALKNDGTLWLWNVRNLRYNNYSLAEIEAAFQNTPPTRLSKNTDWLAISGDTALAADGSLWVWPLATAADHFGWYDGEARLPSLLDYSHQPQRLGNIFDQAQ